MKSEKWIMNNGNIKLKIENEKFIFRLKRNKFQERENTGNGVGNRISTHVSMFLCLSGFCVVHGLCVLMWVFCVFIGNVWFKCLLYLYHKCPLYASIVCVYSLCVKYLCIVCPYFACIYYKCFFMCVLSRYIVRISSVLFDYSPPEKWATNGLSSGVVWNSSFL